MPKCKNDSKRTYSGDEPSPKGKGYCAHAEPLGKTMKGRDGKTWEVKGVSSGSKRWVKVSKSPKKSHKKSPKKSPKNSPKIVLKRVEKVKNSMGNTRV